MVLGHRQAIARQRALWETMVEELEVASKAEGQSLIERLAEIVSGPVEGESEEQSSRRADRMQRQLAKLLDHGSRVDTAKKLAETLEKIVRLDREAFGIDSKVNEGNSFEDLLKRLEQTG